jgi:predicted nucleic acid-binding Zn ribbon protein
MRTLESLDLSKNKISGEIPPSISNLTSLSYMNLSYNNLSGRIPSGRQLDTISADNPSLMYIGNSELCGPPLQNSCSGEDDVIHGDQRSRQEHDPMSFYLGLVLGLVVGLWVVFCALLFKKTWRISYFQFIDKLYDRIYVFVFVKWAVLTRKQDK